MQAVAIAAALVSAYGSYQAGVSQREQYRLQAKQSTVEGERRAIQYEQRSNDLLRRLQQTNAALAARAYAGGVDPFSGSPDIVRASNETRAGREYKILLADADAALRGGQLQATLYEQAGQTAYQQGVFSAVSKLGVAAATAGKGGPSTQEPAPVVDRSIYRS